MAEISLNCSCCNRHFSDHCQILKDCRKIRICNEGHLWFNCSCHSTIFIKKGNYPWFSVDMLLSDEAKEVFKKYNALQKLPNVQTGIMELQNEIQDEDSTFETISEKLKRTPKFALLVLNMAANCIGTDIEHVSLKHAAAIIGREALFNIILSASLIEFKSDTVRYPLSEFWKENLTTAVIAQAIFEKYGEGDMGLDMVYLSACFANIGKLVGALCFPNEIDKMYSGTKDRKKMSTWRQTESLYHFPKTSILSEVGAVVWGMPQSVIDVIRDYRKDSFADNTPKGKLPLTGCIEFSSFIYYWLSLNPHLIDAYRMLRYKEQLGLNDAEMEKLVSSFVDHMNNINELVDNFY